MAPPGAEGQDLVDQLRSLEARLVELLREKEGDLSEMEVWRVYAGLEKVVATLKARLGYETPGVRFKLPKAEDPKVVVEKAMARLSLGLATLERGQQVEAVGELREARNLLRGYLTEKRRALTRKRPG